MIANNDLRVYVYLRSMSVAMGFDEMKRSVIDNLLNIEQEIKTDPELLNIKTFDPNPVTLQRTNPTRRS